jgi:ubiquinone/menaquinone biosynthesis C-methylase UbiE
MTIKQSQIFKESEGDSYFSRNQKNMESAIDKYVVQKLTEDLSPFKDSIRNILEIGCANGVKLRRVCSYFSGATGLGIDPSRIAVDVGNLEISRESQGGVRLEIGTADSLPVENQSVDLVFFGFCLYLMDRQDLFKAVAEADRVLRPGGFIAILDFDSNGRSKNPYSHKAGVYSYKNAYADLFTASGHYCLVSKASISHSNTYFSRDNYERVALQILYKEFDAY